MNLSHFPAEIFVKQEGVKLDGHRCDHKIQSENAKGKKRSIARNSVQHERRMKNEQTSPKKDGGKW